MKVLFQKPRWATATFRVSAGARSAAIIAISTIANASILRITSFYALLLASVPRTSPSPACEGGWRGARGAADSILLDVFLAHHAAPTRELIAQEFAEFCARGRRRRGAGLKELLAYVGRIEHGNDRVVQFRHHGRRCLSRGQQAVPVVGDRVGETLLGERAHVRQ